MKVKASCLHSVNRSTSHLSFFAGEESLGAWLDSKATTIVGSVQLQLKTARELEGGGGVIRSTAVPRTLAFHALARHGGSQLEIGSMHGGHRRSANKLGNSVLYRSTSVAGPA